MFIWVKRETDNMTRVSYRILRWGGGGGGGGFFGIVNLCEIVVVQIMPFWGGSGSMPPQKRFEKNSCPEIESGGFWQLPTLEQGFRVIIYTLISKGKTGLWGDFPGFPPPLYETLMT